MAVDDNMHAEPYTVSYPGQGDELKCPEKYCGWNHRHIKDNKGSFFYVIDDLNRKGLFDTRRVDEWEKQLLFAIAMQVSMLWHFLPISLRALVHLLSLLLSSCA